MRSINVTELERAEMARDGFEKIAKRNWKNSTSNDFSICANQGPQWKKAELLIFNILTTCKV
jgi:hypothetical protein